MKITANIDCTAAEARELLGLPAVKTVQDEWMRKVAEQMNENVQNFSAEELQKKWISGASGGADWMNAILSGFAQGTTARK